MEEFTDLDVFTESNSIVQSLKNKKCTEAINWCTQNRSKLTSSELEFELRIQEFISLIKKDKYTQAVKYARKNLAKFAEENLEKFKMIMGMLAFSKDKITTIDKYKDLLNDEKWDWLIDKFIKESYHLHSLTEHPLLIKCLDIGVSVLKTIF